MRAFFGWISCGLIRNTARGSLCMPQRFISSRLSKAGDYWGHKKQSVEERLKKVNARIKLL